MYCGVAILFLVWIQVAKKILFWDTQSYWKETLLLTPIHHLPLIVSVLHYIACTWLNAIANSKWQSLLAWGTE